MKKNIIASCVICIFAIIFSTGVLGVSTNNIENDARKRQKIDSDWEVAMSVNDEISAMLFYDNILDNHVFSIYVKRSSFSFGYFFRDGGSYGDMMDSVLMFFSYDAKGSALLSMNKNRVAKINVDNGINVTQIDIEPTKPFAVVIPANSVSVILFDADNNVVPISVIQI